MLILLSCSSTLSIKEAPLPATAMRSPVLPARNFRLAERFQAAIGELVAAVREWPDWLRTAAG